MKLTVSLQDEKQFDVDDASLAALLAAVRDMQAFGTGVVFTREDGSVGHVEPEDWPAMIGGENPIRQSDRTAFLVIVDGNEVVLVRMDYDLRTRRELFRLPIKRARIVLENMREAVEQVETSMREKDRC